MWGIAIQAVAAQMALQEEIAFNKRIESLPMDEKIEIRKDRAQEKEKYRLEAIAESRHRETVRVAEEIASAIRMSNHM